MIGNLLINEPPLQVLPTLAKAIGLNEALVTQQVHYWLRISKNKRDGSIWVYKTYDEWQEEFPFWSISTIKRVISSLEKQSILISTSKYNKMPMDRTKWYTINYSALERQPLCQNDTMLGSDCTNAQVKMTPPLVQNDTMQGVKVTPAITRDYTENTTENTTETTTMQNHSSLSSEIFKFYENEYGPLSPYVIQEIDYMIEDIGEPLLLEAMKMSVLANKRTIKYTAAIVRNWKAENIHTLDDLQAKQNMKERETNEKYQRSNEPAKQYDDGVNF